jgi:putative spermidine/putrescine transport system substrate-binding protein
VTEGTTRRGLRPAIALGIAALALAAAGCSGDGERGRVTAMLRELGAGEGRLELVAWAGYVEDGSTDPNVDWVTDFERETGCRVRVRIADSSDQMIALMRTGDYDGVSASGDATLRLIEEGEVAPVNTDLIPNYADVFEGLKNRPHNSVDGQAYGVPHGRGANLLMWRTDVVTTPPDSWGAVFDPRSPYRGRITAYDSPLAIADAAVYLMAMRPELGIRNPYALDEEQFAAAVELLKRQRELVSEYWSDYTREQAAFIAGKSVLGTTWQLVANLLAADEVPIATTLPKEGATGWSDTWMISSRARHPNCMYRWMNHIISPQANAAVAEWYGQAPANAKACALTVDEDFCETFHAADEAYFARVWYWTTPTKDCLDGRGKICTDWSDWADAWAEIRAD